MKNLFYLSISILISCTLLITSSCDKQEMEPNLVPSTTSGENTMGFYLDGDPVNIEGETGGFCGCGVSGGINIDDVVRIFGSSDEPDISITIFFPLDSLDRSNEVVINESLYRYEEIESIDDSPLGGRFFQSDSLHQGTIKILRLDSQVIAGTFEFDAIHAESGETIQVTDGRFDIKR